MSNTSMEIFRNIHNEAMDLVTFARLGYDPRNKDRVYSEADKIHDFEKALEMEKHAIGLIQEQYDRTHHDGDKLTESIYSRSAAWFAISAGKFDEAEKIALNALARGAHPEEREKLYKVLFAAISNQGFPYHLEPEHAPQLEHELAAV